MASASPLDALAELDWVVEVALQRAGCGPADLQAGVFSLAGADWPEDDDYLLRHLRQCSFGFDPVVINDSIGGLRLAVPKWEGIAVICGTGNAVGARRRDGGCFHLGFWPDTVGAGSLSQEALDAVLRDHLGLGPPTSLTDRALGLYESPDPVEMQHRFTRRGGYGRSEIVRMSPVLCRARSDAGITVGCSNTGRGVGRLGAALIAQ